MARRRANRLSVLEDCKRVLDEVLSTDEQSRQIAKLQNLAVGLHQDSPYLDGLSRHMQFL